MEKFTVELPEEIRTMALHVDALTYNKIGSKNPEDVKENQFRAAALSRAIGAHVVSIVLSQTPRSSGSLPAMNDIPS